MAARSGAATIMFGVPTSGEKKALLFLSLVGVLGAGVRLVAATRAPVPSEAELTALDAQIRTVDSVRRGARAGRSGRRKTRAAGGGRGAANRGRGRGGDVAAQDAGRSAHDPTPSPSAAPLHPLPVDLDRASAAEMEPLPGIGPTLARRIAASRDSSGPFGSIEELQSRVRGVGPALAKRLAPAVTFSARQSPPSAERTEPFGSGETPARGKRRPGR